MSSSRSTPRSRPTSAPAVPPAFICPISKSVMVDPVMDRDGNSYERSAVLAWIESRGRSPLTGRSMKTSELVENTALCKIISEHASAPSPVPAGGKFKLNWAPAPTFSEGWVTVLSPYGQSDEKFKVLRSTLKAKLSALGFKVKSRDGDGDYQLVLSAKHARTRERLFLKTEGSMAGDWECWVYLTCRASFTGLDALLEKMDFDLVCCVLTTIPHGHSVTKFTPFSRSARGSRYEIIADSGSTVDYQGHIPSTLLQLVFEGQPENILGKVMLEYLNQELDLGGPTITMFEVSGNMKSRSLLREILLEATEYWLVERGIRSNVTLYATDVQSAKEAAMFRSLGFKCCDEFEEEYSKKIHTDDFEEYRGLAYRSEWVPESLEVEEESYVTELRRFTRHAAQQFGGWGAQALRNARDAAAGIPIKRTRK